MGVVFRSKFIFFHHPRTGGNALQDSLLALSSINNLATHHDHFKIGQHMSRPQMINTFPGYENLPGICVIRNPFEIIARWFIIWRMRKTVRLIVKDNRGIVHKDFKRDGLICYHVPHCKYILRYENDLLRQLNTVLIELGCIPRKGMPTLNVTKNSIPYQECYNQQDLDAVLFSHGPEIERLGYEFEGEPLRRN